MGAIFTFPAVPQRSPVHEGKERICVSGWPTSPHVTRASTIARTVQKKLNFERRQPSQGLAQHHIETLDAYTTYMVAVCIGLRKGYGARVGALYIGSRISRSHIR